MNAQSDAALFVSCLSGMRDSDPSTVFESTTVAASAVPSTRLYVCPSIVAAVISPSYENASSSAFDAVSISATPSGAPFCASMSTWRYAPAASEPVSGTRAYSAPSPPFTRTSAMPSSVAAERALVRDLHEAAGVRSDLVVVDLVDHERRGRRRRRRRRTAAGDAAKLDEIRRRHDDVERPRCAVEARAGRPVERAERGRSCGPLRTGGALCPCGASWTSRARLAGRTRRAGRTIGPAGPTAPAAPVSPFGPWRPAGPGAPAGPAGALRTCRATFVPRDDALVPPTVGCVTHDAEEPLARLLAADDHAVCPRTRSRERRRARHCERGDARR